MTRPRIVSASISAMPKDIFDKMPEVTATFDDGSKVVLFSYYPDELSFTEQEFIGLTEEEACHLKVMKDFKYLQS